MKRIIACSAVVVMAMMGSALAQERIITDGDSPEFVRAPIGGDQQLPSGVVFHSGDPNYLESSECSLWKNADDFSVYDTVTISSIDFTAMDSNNTNFSDWDGTVIWEIRSDTNQMPGFIIAEGVGVNITRVFNQTSRGWDWYNWSMDLDQEVELIEGRYWLALKLNQNCTIREDFYWARTESAFGYSAYDDINCMDVWDHSNGKQYSFTLYGANSGGELYNNGRPDYKAGRTITSVHRAEDFTLSEEATVSGMRLYLLDPDSDFLVEWDETGQWEILTDANGVPGTSIAQGDMKNPQAVFPEERNNGEFWELKTEFDQIVCLEPGTYWISVHLNTPCFPTDLTWATTRTNSGSSAFADDCGNQWQTETGELAFEILGARGCDVVFDNGRSLYFDGYELVGQKVADDFTLAKQTTLRSVEFNIFDTDQDHLSEWDGTGQWEIWTDSGGAPRTMIYSGSMNNAVYSFDRFTMPYFYYYYDITFDLGVDICIDPGTYWLALHLNQPCGQPVGLYWSASVYSGDRAYLDDDCDGGWNASNNGMSFLIRGTEGCECLTLANDGLRGGEVTTFTISDVQPGEKVALVYGTQSGVTNVNDYLGYCASFDIKAVNQSRLIGQPTADGNGEATVSQFIPPGVVGLRVLTQAAERNTCPDTCMSNVLDQVVE